MPAPYMTPQRTNQNAGLLGLLDSLKQHNATVAARPAGRPRPVANQAWMQQQGFDPAAGLGGVGGQYVPNYENRLGLPSPNALMDPRQLGGGPAPRADTRGLRQGFTTMIGQPTPGGLPADVAAGRQAFAANRREASLAPRQELVQQRGIANADARRVRMGNLTYDERLQAGVPGLAVERERAGGLRDVANIQAGVSRDAIAAQERVAQAANEVQLALKRGDWKAAAKAQRAQITADRELKNLESTTALGVAGLQTEAGLKQVESTDRFRQEELGLRKEELSAQRADRYQAEADAAYERGDFRAGDRAQAKANQASGGTSQAPGLPTESSGQSPVRSLPAEVRQQLSQMEPRALVAELRRRGMTDQEINMELAQIFGQGSMLGLSTGIYDRTSDNPYGWGLETVDPATGEAGDTFVGSLLNTTFPTRKSRERERKRNPGLMYESFP